MPYKNELSPLLINAVTVHVKSWYGTCVESRCDAVNAVIAEVGTSLKAAAK